MHLKLDFTDHDIDAFRNGHDHSQDIAKDTRYNVCACTYALPVIVLSSQYVTNNIVDHNRVLYNNKATSNSFVCYNIILKLGHYPGV